MLCEMNSNVLIFTSQYNNRNNNHHNCETINFINNNDNNADNVNGTAIHRNNNGPSTITNNNDVIANNSDIIANDDDDRAGATVQFTSPSRVVNWGDTLEMICSINVGTVYAYSSIEKVTSSTCIVGDRSIG